MRLVPAVDIRGGLCVNLIQGDYSQETVFSEDPVAQAHLWWEGLCDAGASENGIVHIVDLDGAKAGRCCIETELRAMAQAGIPFEVGGGIRNMETIDALMATGAARVILGTAAHENPELLQESCKKYPGKIVVGIDARDGKVSLSGWLEDTATSAMDFAQTVEAAGASRIVYTDILRDGMMQGANHEGTRALAEVVQIPVTLSGGVSSLDDIYEAREQLAQAGVDEIIVGRALYLGAFTIAEAVQALQQPV